MVLRAEDIDGRAGFDHSDLAFPVQLERCRADDEQRPVGVGAVQGNDGLARLAQPHVVGEDGAAVAAQEIDALDLVLVQAGGDAGVRCIHDLSSFAAGLGALRPLAASFPVDGDSHW